MIFTYPNLIDAIIFIESFVFAQMVGIHLRRRGHYLLKVALAFAVGLSISYFLPVFGSESFALSYLYALFMYLTILGLVLASSAICFAGSWASFYLCAGFGYLLHHTLGKVISLLLLPFFADNPSFFNPLYAIIYSVIMVGFMVGVGFFVVRRKGIDVLLNKRRIALLVTMIVLIDIVLSALATIADVQKSGVEIFKTLLDVYGVVSSLLVVFIFFVLLNNQYIDREMLVMKELYKESASHYEASKAAMASLHDMKHRLNAIVYENISLTEEEKREIGERIKLIDGQYNTQNETLNIILTEKALVCSNLGIQFDCMADGEKLSFMNVRDLYSLFGNALTNAINATSAQKEGEAKLIMVNVHGNEHYANVHIENTFDGTLLYEEGLPKTSQEDTFSHGFGIKSMKAIAEQYGGTMVISSEEGVFQLDFLFPRKQSGKEKTANG